MKIFVPLKNTKTKSIAMPYFIWCLGALFFLMEYFIRVSPSVIAQELMATFHVEAFALGGLSAFFYYAYISMQIPVGILVDRFGAHKLLVAATLLCAINIGIFSLISEISLAYLTRFLIGLGAAFAFVGTLKLISTWFPPKRFALFAGITQALGMVGAIIGNAPLSFAFHTYGWRHVMWFMAGLFLLLSLFILLFIRDYNPDTFSHKITHQKTIQIIPSLKIVLANPQTWLNCFFIGLLYGPTATFGEQWGVTFIATTHHVSTTYAAAEVGTLFFGLALGCPILGWVSDRFERRLGIMRLAAFFCFILISIIIYAPHYLPHQPEFFYIFLLFLYGFFNSGIVPSYALAAEINPHELNGIALGVTNMASILLGAIFIPLIGWIIDHLWDGTKIAGAPIYSSANFEWAFLLLPSCFLLSFLISFALKETYCQPTKNNDPTP